MLTPSLGYEAAKGRELELERKAAAGRLLEEALAGQRLQQPGMRPSLLQRIKNAVAPVRPVDEASAETRPYHKQKQVTAP